MLDRRLADRSGGCSSSWPWASDAYPLERPHRRLCFPIPPNTTADRAGDLLAATSALTYLQCDPGAPARPRPPRLTDRIRGLVAELITLQNDDGGWPWVAGTDDGPGRGRATG